jgi:hypothetical protein
MDNNPLLAEEEGGEIDYWTPGGQQVHHMKLSKAILCASEKHGSHRLQQFKLLRMN